MFKGFSSFFYAKLGVIIIFVGGYAVTMLVVAVFHLVELKRETSAFQFITLDYSALHVPRANRFFHILTGQEVENGEAALAVPYAIIIDNALEARPQMGLDAARIVYEVPVEGGVTRFLAFFDLEGDTTRLTSQIGPVRSARPYFLDFASELRAFLAHVGGSPASLEILRQRSAYLAHVDEMSWWGRYFIRDTSEPSPHNVFTNAKLLREVKESIAGGEWGENLVYDELAWEWGTAIAQATTSVSQSVRIDFSTYSYEVEYRYDPTRAVYTRYQSGEIHRSDSGIPLEANNVLIAFMQTRVIDDVGRLDIKTTGSGDAIVCIGGTCEKGEWRKESAHTRLRFFVNKKPVALQPGKTWVHVVPVGRKVEING